MSALSLQRREAINSRSKHSLESNHEKGTKTSYTDGFVPLYTSKKSYYAFSQTDFYHKTNPNLFFRKGSDQKFLVEHRRFELLTSTMRMSRATNCANAPNFLVEFCADLTETAFLREPPTGLNNWRLVLPTVLMPQIFLSNFVQIWQKLLSIGNHRRG